LTAAGRALIPHLAPIFGRVNRQLLAGFSEEEVQQITAMLQRMLDNLRGGEAQP
jgi:DNA-binding MarR family transcriptional regulator